MMQVIAQNVTITPLISEYFRKRCNIYFDNFTKKKHFNIIFVYIKCQSLKFINDYKIIYQTPNIFTGEKKNYHLQAPMKGKSHLQSNRRNVYLVGMIKSNIKYSSTPPFHPFLFLYSVSNTDR